MRSIPRRCWSAASASLVVIPSLPAYCWACLASSRSFASWPWLPCWRRDNGGRWAAPRPLPVSLALASAAVFGLDIWRAWFDLVAGGSEQYRAWIEVGRLNGISVYACVSWLGTPRIVASVAQAAATLGTGGVVYWVYRQPAPEAIRAPRCSPQPYSPHRMPPIRMPSYLGFRPASSRLRPRRAICGLISWRSAPPFGSARCSTRRFCSVWAARPRCWWPCSSRSSSRRSASETRRSARPRASDFLTATEQGRR